MHRYPLPRRPSRWFDTYTNDPPERKALELLLAALELAEQAVRDQHPRLDHNPRNSTPSLPASELLAELLVERCAELQCTVERYNRVIDLLLERDNDPF
jgi:hypothetical protein